MIDRPTATEIARKWIQELTTTSPDGPFELCLVDENTIETEFGWIFFWTSRLYHETGDFKYALAGNAPIIIDREDGSVHVTGTALPIEHYIDEYRKEKRQKSQI